jgi:hypothetical protein
VASPDDFVAEVIDRSAAGAPSDEPPWASSARARDEAETDDLRLAMRQYRVFLHQLLSV